MYLLYCFLIHFKKNESGSSIAPACAAHKMDYILPKIVPIPHVDDLVVGNRYFLEIRTKTKKAFKTAGEMHQVRCVSGVFQKTFPWKEFGKQTKLWAAFTDVHIEDSNAIMIPHDNGKINAPYMAHEVRKPIVDIDGTITNLKYFGHQEMDSKTLHTKTIVFDFTLWNIGEGAAI